jgi:hypothetical protein
MKRQITGSGSVARLALLWEQRRFLFMGLRLDWSRRNLIPARTPRRYLRIKKGKEWPRCSRP